MDRDPGNSPVPFTSHVIRCLDIEALFRGADTGERSSKYFHQLLGVVLQAFKITGNIVEVSPYRGSRAPPKNGADGANTAPHLLYSPSSANSAVSAFCPSSELCRSPAQSLYARSRVHRRFDDMVEKEIYGRNRPTGPCEARKSYLRRRLGTVVQTVQRVLRRLVDARNRQYTAL